MKEEKNLKKKYLIATLLPALMAMMYGSGYFAQLFKNYQDWQQNGGAIGDASTPLIPSAGIIDCLKSIFILPYGLYGIFICFSLLTLLVLMIMRMGIGGRRTKDKERNFDYSDKGTYGTAGYLTPKEMDGVLDLADPKHNKGIILGDLNGKCVMLPVDTKLNRNIAVWGASGSMKSRAFVRNMALQAVRRGESAIFTDPKGELYEELAEYFEENQYVTKVFNLVNPQNSDSWDCMAEIEKSELMAQIYADTVIKNTGGEKGDHFWDNSELNLLKALILYVDQTYDEGTMGDVYDLITSETESSLNKIFSVLPPGHPAKAPYSIFRQAAENVRGGIIIGLGSRLQVFQNLDIRNITSKDEIDLELPGQQKCAYFLITSDQDSTFDFLSSLFFSFLFIKLVRFADRNGIDGKLPVHVNIIADEFPNIGLIPDFKKKISTIRSRNISISIIFQNLAQLQNRYPLNAWQEILGNVSTQLFLGATDPLTASFISDRTGDVTIAVDSQAKQLNSWRISDYTPQYRKTSSIGKRKLLTPDEVLRMPFDEALVIIQGQKVLKVKKFDYSRHPDFSKLKKRKVSEHVPDWRKQSPEHICKQTTSQNTSLGGDETVKKKIQPTDKKSIMS